MAAAAMLSALLFDGNSSTLKFPPKKMKLFKTKSDSLFLGMDSYGKLDPSQRVCSSGGNSRSTSLASISSDGSLPEGHVVEQEDIVTLTHDCRGFKEALGKLRRIFHPERDKSESTRVSAHEKLGEVLKILRSILGKYPPLQSTELLMAAGSLIQQVKAFNYEAESPNPVEFFEAIDQLALAFSSRVSEYLMGDLDSSAVSVGSTKAKAAESGNGDLSGSRSEDVSAEALTPQQLDAVLLRLQQGVEYALHRAKVWSKYAKDVSNYVEKRATLEADYAKSLTKLANSMRPILTDESFLPFQSIYCTALDQDIDNSKTMQATCNLLNGQKFLEPLQSRRAEHEKARKALKDLWQKEMKRTQEAADNFRRAKALYRQRQQDYHRAKEQLRIIQQEQAQDQGRLDKRKKIEDDALQKALEAESTYKACVAEANERHLALQKVKADVLKQVRELIYQCDQTMKAVTVSYFQLQHTSSAPCPVQFQTLCESSRLYEPGSQYMEFVKRLPQPHQDAESNSSSPLYVFEPFHLDKQLLDQSRKSTGSMESSEDSSQHQAVSRTGSRGTPMRAWGSVHPGSSDTDSISSSQSAPSQDTSPPGSPVLGQRRLLPPSSGDEPYQSYYYEAMPVGGQSMSKAAVTHAFRKLKTPSRCRECDSYVYFQGAECTECGLSCHKKCLETLAIQCGHKRLPRKMTTFGVDLTQHLQETQAQVPHLVCKCVAEIDRRGTTIKGIYRVSGVKHRVEKLCQSFENGADLVDLTDVHPNVIANVLKLYFRQLPEPLLTFRLYQDFIRIAKESPNNTSGNLKTSISELKELCKKLPKEHLQTLAFLMHHLKRASTEAENNNMPPSNLGIVFGPTLLRTPEGSASLNSLVDTVHQTRAIEMFIMFADEIFGLPETVLPKDYNSRYRGDADIKVWSKASGIMRSLSTTGGNTSPRKLKDTEILSSSVDRRPTESQEEAPLPGYLPGNKDTQSLSEEDLSQSAEDLPLIMSSDDELPDTLLPDDSTPKRSPLIPRQTETIKPLKPPKLVKSETEPKPYPRKRSPNLATATTKASGTDSSIDSDCSFDPSLSDRLSSGTDTKSPRHDNPPSFFPSPRVSARNEASDIQVPRHTSLDNLTSSESSQEVESLHTPEDSQSSEFAEDERGASSPSSKPSSTQTIKPKDMFPQYVSPYLSSGQQGSYHLGSTLLYQHSSYALSSSPGRRSISSSASPEEVVKKAGNESDVVKASLVEEQQKRVAQAFAGRLHLWPEKESGVGQSMVVGITRQEESRSVSISQTTTTTSFQPQPSRSSKLHSVEVRGESRRVEESKLLKESSKSKLSDSDSSYTTEPQFV